MQIPGLDPGPIPGQLEMRIPGLDPGPIPGQLEMRIPGLIPCQLEMRIPGLNPGLIPGRNTRPYFLHSEAVKHPEGKWTEGMTDSRKQPEVGEALQRSDSQHEGTASHTRQPWGKCVASLHVTADNAVQACGQRWPWNTPDSIPSL
ncbi:hypothetical protein P7K49_031445 [Saguinus oedipus]|uniref:Uncharacterized protein n=1 Tax=Saguinus oedipus TaxID=9490 RepID=A0ABQ9U085_SAGOE|nr:hypothetical protein P7K49_031445 [Saguinus oedipus]